MHVRSWALFLLFFMAFFQCAKKAEPEKVWIMEDNSFCVIEAESAASYDPEVSFWKRTTEVSNYSGESALAFQDSGELRDGPLPIDAPKTGKKYTLSYKVWVEEPGDYELKIRNFHRQKDGDNDAWVSINENMFRKIWDQDVNLFTWSDGAGKNLRNFIFQLKKGVNTIEIAGRSNGWIIDQLLIVRAGMSDVLLQQPDVRMQESPLITQGVSDNKSPSTPQNLRTGRKEFSYIVLNWHPSSDNFHVYGYDIYHDEKLIGSTTDTLFPVTGLKAETEHTFQVSARDFHGNISRRSEKIKVKVPGFNEKTGLLIDTADETPVIDGVMEPVWLEHSNYSPSLLIGGSIDSKMDMAAFIKMMWDDQFLYLLVKAIDDRVREDSPEGIHLWLDPNNSKDTFFSYYDRHYLLQWQNDGLEEVYGKTPDNAQIAYALWEGKGEKRQQHGYIIECAIPWASIGIQADQGHFLGMEIRLDDYDASSETPEASFVLVNPQFLQNHSPLTWGTARLVKNYWEFDPAN